MTDPCPLQRPSAGQLLTRSKTDENEAISQLQDIIRCEKEKNRKKDEEILVLKKKLAQFEAAKHKKTKRAN